MAFNAVASCLQAETVIADIVICGPGTDAIIQVSADHQVFVGMAGFNTSDATGNIHVSLEAGEVTGRGIVRHAPTLTSFLSGTLFGTTGTQVGATLTTGAITFPASTTVVVRMHLAGTCPFRDRVSFIEGIWP